MCFSLPAAGGLQGYAGRARPIWALTHSSASVELRQRRLACDEIAVESFSSLTGPSITAFDSGLWAPADTHAAHRAAKPWVPAYRFLYRPDFPLFKNGLHVNPLFFNLILFFVPLNAIDKTHVSYLWGGKKKNKKICSKFVNIYMWIISSADSTELWFDRRRSEAGGWNLSVVWTFSLLVTLWPGLLLPLRGIPYRARLSPGYMV